MKARFFLFLLTGLAVISCRNSDSGSDNRFSKEKSLDGVARLQINGAFNLYLTQSDQESLTLDGSTELAEKLKFRQEGDLLILEMEEYSSSFFDKKELRVNLSISDLTEFEFDGVGNVQTTGSFIVDRVTIRGEGVGNLELEFETEELEADMNLVGKMELKGKATKATIKNEGIGNIDASRLITQDMDLISSGIGKVDIHCEGNLSMKVEGIGKVTYSGNPNVVKKEISGIGKVEPK
jgi:hypothetical protein